MLFLVAADLMRSLFTTLASPPPVEADAPLDVQELSLETSGPKLETVACPVHEGGWYVMVAGTGQVQAACDDCLYERRTRSRSS